MDPSSFYIFFILIFLLNYQPKSYCQQKYLDNNQTNCDPSVSKGYLCNGDLNPCQSFVTFQSRPPYDSPISIAYLLGSEASSIASINNITIGDRIPFEKLIIVPVSCSCTGNIYQHSTPYTIKKNDTYFTIANDIYQGLTTCQALLGQNYYDALNLEVGAELMVPLRCACPSSNQTANGVISLLMYMVKNGDSISSIANIFRVDEASILEANVLSKDSLIYNFTPILVPLESESCKVNPGSFFCQCPNGFLADGGEEGLNCRHDRKKFPIKLVALLGTGIGLGLLLLFLLLFKLCKFLKKRRYKIQKEKLFEQNGGLLLQQRLSSWEGGKPRLFTAEELQRATDNYNQSRFLGRGGYGTVYKGMLPDGSIVAVKRSKTIDKSQIEQFINEVVILSQINHRNIVKLLGCCMETDFPLLVYEFVSNGTLSHHIHEQKDQESSLPWENRFRIASEVAEAVAYMHSAASFPIFHRDIKSSNILVDDQYSAKVSDFGTSRSIPYDRTHLTTAVQGTFGYLDPEYFYTSQFTEKSDVYSFGVVLIELLTGEKPFSFDRTEGEKNLVAHFISSTMEDHLLQILDPRVAREARKEDIYAISKLAIRCLRLNGKMRPTMKEVAMELDGLRKSHKRHPSLLRGEALFMLTVGETTQESIEEDIAFPLELESTSI